MSKVIGAHFLELASADATITGRAVGGSVYLEKIEEMDRELSKVIEDFDRAVDVEALQLVKNIGKKILPLLGHNRFSMARVEQELLLTRLKRVETGYDLTLCCMEGTRETLLNQIVTFRSSTVMKVTSNSLGLNLGTLLSVPRIYEI